MSWTGELVLQLAGFGFINTGKTPTIPTSRQGTIVGRFVFPQPQAAQVSVSSWYSLHE